MFKTFRNSAPILALVLVLTLAMSLALPTAVAARGAAQDPDGVPGTLERGADQDPNGLRTAPGAPADGVAASMRSLIDPFLSL